MSILEPGPRKYQRWASGSAIGNVQNEFQKPLNEYIRTMQGSIRLGKCLRIVSDAKKSFLFGHAWFEKCSKLVSDAVFEKRANENNEKASTEPYPPRSEKRVKTCSFRNMFEKHKKERVVVWWSWNAKNAWKRVVFDDFLRRGCPAKAPKSHLDLHVGSGYAKNEIWEPKNTHKVFGRISKNAWKRVVFATFRKKWWKAN